jgi:hypothetical protein
LNRKTKQGLDPFRFVLIAVAGWMNQQQQDAIDYLREENRILCQQLGGRRLRLNDAQRRRLASKAKRLGRKMLAALATIVTPRHCWLGTGSSSPKNMMGARDADRGDRGRREKSKRSW